MSQESSSAFHFQAEWNAPVVMHYANLLFYRWNLASLVLLAFAGSGCGPAQAPLPKPDATKHLIAIAMAYSQATAKLAHPPASLEELRPFLQEQGNPEEILKSPQDGQEYVIIYGVDPLQLATSGQNPRVILAYEKTGSGGERNVLIAPNFVTPLTAAEFVSAAFPAGHQPK